MTEIQADPRWATVREMMDCFVSDRLTPRDVMEYYDAWAGLQSSYEQMERELELEHERDEMARKAEREAQSQLEQMERERDAYMRTVEADTREAVKDGNEIAALHRQLEQMKAQLKEG